MASRVAQDAKAFRRGLLFFSDGSEFDRTRLGIIEVIGLVDGQVEVDLL